MRERERLTHPHAQCFSLFSICTNKQQRPGVLSFDILTNLQRSGTNHDHDQPAHLRIKPELADVPNTISIKEYAGPEQNFCPAKVYEYHESETTGEKELVINAQNCVHCKCCSIKMPKEYIKWTVPEGGGGPGYQIM